MPPKPYLRPSQPDDNPAIAAIIRSVMTSYGAVGPGFSIEDAEVDEMHETYDVPRSLLLVVDDGQGRVIGCGGIAPLAGGDDDTCELKKMYFLPEARGLGLGRELMTTLEEAARNRGFRVVYLETLSTMVEAAKLYDRMQYTPLPGPMGNTGHTRCGSFYAKTL
ncbi:MAG: GNAT family N-acetyltransferase [Gemmatimonadales bacterium]